MANDVFDDYGIQQHSRLIPASEFDYTSGRAPAADGDSFPAAQAMRFGTDVQAWRNRPSMQGVRAMTDRPHAPENRPEDEDSN